MTKRRIDILLVEKELAVALQGGAQATIDPFLLSYIAVVHPQSKPEDVIAALDAEIEKIQENPPSDEELRRAVKQARALMAYGSERITNQGFWLGFSEMFASYEWYTSFLENHREWKLKYWILDPFFNFSGHR